MVSSQEIKNDYLQLVHLIEKETAVHSRVDRFLNYLKKYQDKFSNANNTVDQSELREFLRGASRFSDEFIFSDQNAGSIQTLLQNLYKKLSSS